MAPTAAGREAIAVINPLHAVVARRLVRASSRADLAAMLAAMRQLSVVLERLGSGAASSTRDAQVVTSSTG